MGTQISETILLSHEDEARQILIDHYRRSYGNHAEQQVDLLFSMDGYIGRFDYLFSILGDSAKSLQRVLISGYSAGSEMIVARQFGFNEIDGVEVDPVLFQAASKRVAGMPGIKPVLYDGQSLPYDNDSYDLVVSGHIIEHTDSPIKYICEIMRVINPGGFLYIEFPTRYHYIELHTGLVSFEWMPHALRNAVLKALTSRYSFLSPTIKSKYESILTTGLKQISRSEILGILKHNNIKHKEVAYSVPAPGIVRCIIQKFS